MLIYALAHDKSQLHNQLAPIPPMNSTPLTLLDLSFGSFIGLDNRDLGASGN